MEQEQEYHGLGFLLLNINFNSTTYNFHGQARKKMLLRKISHNHYMYNLIHKISRAVRFIIHVFTCNNSCLGLIAMTKHIS